MSFALMLALYVSLSTCDPFPLPPKNVTSFDIPDHPGASISYKETSICEQKGWAGFVNFPSDSVQFFEKKDAYNMSMFFWYFQARENPETAPTAIYLAGGPGESSVWGVASDGGPCYVGSDSNSTYANQWSWTRRANMLYIDQPLSTGYSYESLVNATVDMLFLGDSKPSDTGIVPFEKYDGNVPPVNSTFYHGTLPNQRFEYTALNSVVAARILWKFSQLWFTSFPAYTTSNKRTSVWGNSYAGYWIPPFAAEIVAQSKKLTEGPPTRGTSIELDTVGITNGCIDQLYQAEGYPEMAYNNTYDLQIINKTTYEEALHYFTKDGGCREQLFHCRELGKLHDPHQLGLNDVVNTACVKAESYCYEYLISPFDAFTNRSDFDIAHMKPDPWPPYYIAGYFNQQWVQEELGVPLNWTQDSWVSNNLLDEVTGDPARAAGMADIEYLLDNGVTVALAYGDRDYRCPWTGAEQLSLQANWTSRDAFRDAGYQNIETNATYDGGVVRQHGNLSFSRVFEAGHDCQRYQPETLFRIFDRAMFHMDIASGQIPTSDNYSTIGPSSSNHIKNKLPPAPKPLCYMFNVAASCTMDQYLALINGTAEIIDWIVVNPDGGGGPIDFATGL